MRWDGSSWAQQPAPNPGGPARDNELLAGAATSAANAWAVGYYRTDTGYRTLTEHWNGTIWAQEPSLSPSRSASAWAVGSYYNGTADQTLIERWNGTTWKQMPGPNPSTSSNALTGVAAISATNAWAVGRYLNGSVYRTLIAHWNGTTWTGQPSPDPAGPTRSNALDGVAATSATNIWGGGLLRRRHRLRGPGPALLLTRTEP